MKENYNSNRFDEAVFKFSKSAKFGGDLLSAVLEFMRLMVKKFKEGSKALFEELKPDVADLQSVTISSHKHNIYIYRTF